MNKMLPKGWIEVQIEQLIDSLESGSRPKGGVKGIESGIPSIGGEHVNDKGGFNFQKIRFVPITYYKSLKNGHIEIGDILIVKDGATTGKTSYVDATFPFSNAVVNEHVFVLKISKNSVSKFTFFFLWSESGKANILANFQGSAQGGINRLFVTNTVVPLPPLNEQKRIVARLDQIIPRIEQIKERLDKIPAIIKRFRQSVLTAAVTGRLTEKWREGRPDFDNPVWIKPKNNKIISHEWYRNEWNDIDIPENWNCLHLKEVADLRLGKMLDGVKNTGIELEYIRNVNVRWFQFELDDLKTIRLLQEEVKKLSIKNGDVFICEGGEPGRAAVWQSGENKMTFQKALHRVRFNGNVDPHWLVYNLKIDADTGRLSRLFTGSTIKHFTERSLSIYPLLLPPLEEQEEIVRQVDKLFALADKLESHYQKAKARVDKLSQSILAKAFRGELVITEAELAEKEGRDFESAEKLLERILEEKAKLTGSKKSPRARKKIKIENERKNK